MRPAGLCQDFKLVFVLILCFFKSCIAQPAGLPPQPQLAPSPAPLLLVSLDDWTGLSAPGTGLPVTPQQLSVPPGATEIELQLTGPDAVATYDVMDTMRSTLAEFLPVTYNSVSPVAYKNVTSCLELASPALAPIGPIELPSLPADPPSSHTMGGRRLLNRWPEMPRGRALQAEPALAPLPSSGCDPEMRAVFLLFYPKDINATYGQSLVRDVIQSGVFVARLKRRKVDVNRVELLASMRGDSPDQAYRNTPQPPGMPIVLGMTSVKNDAINLAPAPSFDAAAQQAIASASPYNHTAVNVYFTLVLTGYDAVETNGNCLQALTHMLTDTLYTGDIDYLTPENTAVTDVQQLKALSLPQPTGRRLLQANRALETASKVEPLKAIAHARKGHPKIVGGSRGAGKVAATDGRPRKGQGPLDVDAPGFDMEVTGGALKGQQQKGQLKSAGGIAVHLPGSAVDDDAREAIEVAGGLMDGRPRKGHGPGGDSAVDSAAAGDLKRRPGRGSRGASGYGERILTRLGAIRIRAPGANPDDGEGETLEGSGRPLPTGASSNATAEEEYQKWGNRLASRTGELCNLREGARVAGTHCLRSRSLQQAPQITGGPAPDAAAAPAPAPSNASDLALLNFGPVPSLAVSYEVFAISEPGPAVIADKLSYFIRTGQMVRLFQSEGFRIDYVQLAKYSPLPEVLAPAPSGEAGAASSEAGVSKVAKLVGAIVIPIAFVAILAASIFAYLFFRNKKRHSTAGSEGMPVKDSAQSMHSARSSDKSGLRTSGSGSTTVRSMLDTLYSSRHGISGQEALALASLSKRSLTLPGMGSDWEIDPDELEICRRPDGTEWELGSGSSAKVYKAVRNGVQVVAVKIFTDQVTAEHQLRYAEAFRREIFILRSCHDRNIVQFIGACLQEGQTILVQEYMENGDLYHAIAEDTQSKRFSWYRERLPNGRFAPATGMARRVALDIARGLFFLHSRKVVHFDLKSANILLGRDWTAKIADVGLAKILKDGWLSTLREVGTFSWAAPEVLLGRPCTEKVDIYSFGVMLWELSAGEAPPGRHLRPLRVPEECPADVEAMIARCLDNEPEKRPSARELVEFMVDLPHGLSREDGSDATDVSSSGALREREQEQHLKTGQSLPPVSPKPPPAGMIMPNVFGLQSMLSFKRSTSGLSRSASGRLDRSNSGRSRAHSGEAPLAGQDGQIASAPSSNKPPKPQRSKPVVPSAFMSWASLSFKKDLAPVPPDAASHSDAAEEQELEQAVMESNKSLSAAAAREAEKQVQEVLRATGEAPEEAIAPGGYPTRGAALGGPRKTVHFSDDEADPPAACQKGHAPAGASAPDGAPGAAVPPPGNQAASSQAREQRAGSAQQGAGNAARLRQPGRIATPFAGADEGSVLAGQGASEATAVPARRTQPVVSSPFAAADSASEAPAVSARRAPAVSSPFASADSASEDAGAYMRQPASRTPAVSSPFAAADAASEAPVAPIRETPPTSTPFAAAEAPLASTRSRPVVSSPFAAADDVEGHSSHRPVLAVNVQQLCLSSRPSPRSSGHPSSEMPLSSELEAEVGPGRM